MGGSKSMIMNGLRGIFAKTLNTSFLAWKKQHPCLQLSNCLHLSKAQPTIVASLTDIYGSLQARNRAYNYQTTLKRYRPANRIRKLLGTINLELQGCDEGDEKSREITHNFRKVEAERGESSTRSD